MQYASARYTTGMEVQKWVSDDHLAPDLRMGRVERAIAVTALVVANTGILSAAINELPDMPSGNRAVLSAYECEEPCLAGAAPEALPAVWPDDTAAQLEAIAAAASSPMVQERVAPTQPEAAPGYQRSLSYEQYAQNAPQYIANLPSLERLASLKPELAQQYLAEYIHINRLSLEVTVSVDDYYAFALDRSFNTAFKGVGSYDKTISPKLFVIHWTGMHYDGPEHLAQSMRNDGQKRVAYYMDRNARSYQLFEDDYRMPAHARGVNEFSQGVEIEATGTLDYTPAQIQQAIILAVDFCRRNGLPVNETTIVGHYATALIFRNPYYDPALGSLAPGATFEKFDPPQELMNKVIIPRAIELDRALG